VLEEYLTYSGVRISKSNYPEEQQLNSDVHQLYSPVITIWSGKWHLRSDAGQGSTYYLKTLLLILVISFFLSYPKWTMREPIYRTPHSLMKVAQRTCLDSMNLTQTSPTHNERSPNVMSIFNECSSRIINPFNEGSPKCNQLIIRKFQELCVQIQCKKSRVLVALTKLSSCLTSLHLWKIIS